jgi:hypothetical protein
MRPQTWVGVCVAVLATGLALGTARAACKDGVPNGTLDDGEVCDDGPTPNDGCCTNVCTAVNSPAHAPVPCNDGNVCSCNDPAFCPDILDGDHWRDVATERQKSAIRPVARARTWLLMTGWRRHGLLDPADVPGAG